jgi:hypothetical protein
MFARCKHRSYYPNMASSFLRDVKAHQAHMEKLLEEGSTMSYAIMRSMGILKPFAVRLPAPMLAVLGELVKYGPWESKQEMVYEMIQSSYSEFYADASPEVREKFSALMNRELEKWSKKTTGQVLDLSAGKMIPAKGKRKRAKK